MWSEAEEFLQKDIYIGPLVRNWGKCSVKSNTKSKYFESLLESIVNQQLSGKAASTIFRRVRDLCKGKIKPDIILNLSDLELRSAGLSNQKVKYVKDLSTRIFNNELHILDLDKFKDEEVITELVKVKGIGRWTAEMFLMFSLSRPDIFPVDDLGIKKGFEKVTGKKWDRIKSAKFAEKNWKPYRTVASWYLWRSLENR